MVKRITSDLVGKQRQWRFGGPGRPPVTASAIRGEYFVSMDLIWPAIVWNEGRCWAFFHDLAPAALARIIERLRETELERSAPLGSLTWT